MASVSTRYSPTLPIPARSRPARPQSMSLPPPRSIIPVGFWRRMATALRSTVPAAPTWSTGQAARFPARWGGIFATNTIGLNNAGTVISTGDNGVGLSAGTVNVSANTGTISGGRTGGINATFANVANSGVISGRDAINAATANVANAGAILGGANGRGIRPASLALPIPAPSRVASASMPSTRPKAASSIIPVPSPALAVLRSS